VTIKLLISDIDGTFVRSDKSVSDAVLAACDRLRAAGVQLALISARPASGILWIADKLRLDGAIGAFNGGTIVRPNGTPEGDVLCAERLDPAVAERALALIDRPGVICWVFHKGRWYTTALDDYYTDKERHSTSQEPVVVASFAGLTDAVDKIVAVSGAEAMLANLEDEVAAKLGTGANVIRSQTYYLDITAPRANKGDGVAALAKVYGVDLADVAVIGDQRNDIAMFARAGVTVAMGQAPDAVKAAAQHVTESNDRDGVAHAIDEIILPMVAGR
jgi:Cof subfamily protein (haloacid dehalogenase superfamily)